jgi:hypothetical protein
MELVFLIRDFCDQGYSVEIELEYDGIHKYMITVRHDKCGELVINRVVNLDEESLIDALEETKEVLNEMHYGKYY